MSGVEEWMCGVSGGCQPAALISHANVVNWQPGSRVCLGLRTVDQMSPWQKRPRARSMQTQEKTLEILSKGDENWLILLAAEVVLVEFFTSSSFVLDGDCFCWESREPVQTWTQISKANGLFIFVKGLSRDLYQQMKRLFFYLVLVSPVPAVARERKLFNSCNVPGQCNVIIAAKSSFW